MKGIMIYKIIKQETFETDRQTNKKTYLHYFQDLLRPELDEFCKEAQVTSTLL
jgi:hypothetical protein